MSFDKKQFEALIAETLKEINMYSPAAVNLLMGTASQESHFGTYLRQIEGPALGIFQMEPATHDDIWKNYIGYRQKISETILKLSHRRILPSARDMVFNLKYAIAMARVHYRRAPEKLPEADDISGLGIYWKKYYNTDEGKGTVVHFVKNYHKFIERRTA